MLLKRLERYDNTILRAWKTKFLAKCYAITERRREQIQKNQAYQIASPEDQKKIIQKVHDITPFITVQMTAIDKFKEHSTSRHEKISLTLQHFDEEHEPTEKNLILKARYCSKIFEQEIIGKQKYLENLDVFDAVTLFDCGLRGSTLEEYCFKNVIHRH